MSKKSGGTNIASILKKLFFPTVLFTFFLYMYLFGSKLLPELGPDSKYQYYKVLHYAIEIGIFISGAALINRVLKIFFWDGIVSKSLQGSVPRFLIHFSALIIYFITFTLIGAYVFKLSLTGIWAASSVLAIVIGFALRDMILDLFTGLAINIERPYQIGDWIQINRNNPDEQVLGEVIDINWRSTRLRTEEKTTVVIPNNLMSTFIVTNYTHDDKSVRFETLIYLDHTVHLDRARRVIKSAVKTVLKSEGFFDFPEPQILVGAATESGVIQYRIRYWINPWKGIYPAQSRDRIHSSILNNLSLSGLTPAYPKQEFYYSRIPGKKLHDSKSFEYRKNILKNVSLFNSFEEEELNKLVNRIDERSYKEGETIIKMGDPGESMFILAEGLIEVLVSRENGYEQRVAQIYPGEFFGEMSLLTGEPRSATVKALTDILAFEVKKEHLESLFKTRPDIMDEISEIIAQRRTSNIEELEKASSVVDFKPPTGFSKQLASKIKSFFNILS